MRDLTPELPSVEEIREQLTGLDPATDRRPAIAVVRDTRALEQLAEGIAQSPGGRYIGAQWADEPLIWTTASLRGSDYTTVAASRTYGYRPSGVVGSYAMALPHTVAQNLERYALGGSEVILHRSVPVTQQRTRVLATSALATLLWRHHASSLVCDDVWVVKVLRAAIATVDELLDHETATVAALLEELQPDTAAPFIAAGGHDVTATLNGLVAMLRSLAT